MEKYIEKSEAIFCLALFDAPSAAPNPSDQESVSIARKALPYSFYILRACPAGGASASRRTT